MNNTNKNKCCNNCNTLYQYFKCLLEYDVDIAMNELTMLFFNKKTKIKDNVDRRKLYKVVSGILELRKDILSDLYNGIDFELDCYTIQVKQLFQ